MEQQNSISVIPTESKNIPQNIRITKITAVKEKVTISGEYFAFEGPKSLALLNKMTATELFSALDQESLNCFSFFILSSCVNIKNVWIWNCEWRSSFEPFKLTQYQLRDFSDDFPTNIDKDTDLIERSTQITWWFWPQHFFYFIRITIETKAKHIQVSSAKS